MLIRRQAAKWDIVVPSKVNLFLEVLGKRTDGYHELDTVMLAVSLCDRLRFTATDQHALALRLIPASSNAFEKLSPQDNAWEIPVDSTNLVIRSLEAVRQKYGIVQGMDVELIKGIPAQAGLGGGSSDAAAAIVGGMLAWFGEFRASDAAELASRLGSDINFFIEGRPEGTSSGNWLARCGGRGEKILPIRSDWLIDLVVVQPPVGCSTKDVFGRFGKTNQTKNPSLTVDGLVQALENRDQRALADKLFNRLGDPAAANNPWIDRIQKCLVDEPGVMGSCLSGSGSSVFAVVETADRAKQLAESLRKHYPVRAYAVRSWQTPSIDEQLSSINSR